MFNLPLWSAFADAAADPRFPYAVAIATVAGLVRGFSGFGSALIYMPLISAIYSPAIAAPTIQLVDTMSGLPFSVRAWVFGRDQAGDHSLRCGQMEAIDAEYDECAGVEGERCVAGVGQDQRGEEGAQDRREHQDLLSSPAIDEHPGERADDAEGQRHDQRDLE